MTIVCARFTLVPFTLAFIDALLARDIPGAERELDVRLSHPDWIAQQARFLNFRRADLIHDPSSHEWLARAIVLPDRTMVGHIGFHGPPDQARTVEIGYMVDEPYRRRGYASEAMDAMMA